MKAYRFFSDPNKLVNDGNTGKPLLRFDDKGEYITLDPILSKRLAAKFECKEIELVEVEEQVGDAENDAQTSCFSCPYCDFVAASKGGLSAHIRAKHKEG